MSIKNHDNLIDNSQQALDDLSISNDTLGSDSPLQSSGAFCVESKAMKNQQNAESDFFFVNRELLRSSRWLAEKFTRAQAWVDLFGLAQHTDNFYFVRGIRVDVKRGQLAYSQVTLAHRWKWSRDKVRRYLSYLESGGDIIQQNNEITTIITIVKYDLWQGNKTTNKTTDRQQKNIKQDTYNKVNKDNKVNNNTVEPSSTKNKVSLYTKEGAEIIKAFEDVDAKNKTYYNNTTQRKACDFLLKEYGKEEVFKRIRVLKKTNNTEYFPSITSPNDLKEKWEKLNAQLYKKLNNQTIIL